jgi:hypothetical protein
LKIPLNMNWIQDFVSWPRTKSGIYTVKYAYFMTCLVWLAGDRWLLLIFHMRKILFSAGG